MKPTPAQLAHCVAQLTRYIPSPPTPVPVEQASKWGRKVGDKLQKQDELLNTWLVIRTDSLGVTLQRIMLGDAIDELIRVESKDELDKYIKVRKKRIAAMDKCGTLPLPSGSGPAAE